MCQKIWIYVRKFNNGTNILCATINRDIQREEKTFGNGFYRFRKNILWSLKGGSIGKSDNGVCKNNTRYYI